MKMSNTSKLRERLKNQRGFTIIEVVIVLAIAGLIFAVVFIAVPQLQAAQRDQARNNEMGRLDAAINQYQSNNNGELPTWRDVYYQDVYVNYLDKNFNDPIGGRFNVRHRGGGWPSYEHGRLSYLKRYKCTGNGAGYTHTGSDRAYAVLYELEQGGLQCRDNQ